MDMTRHFNSVGALPKAPPSFRPQVAICDDDPDFSWELAEALQTRGFVAAPLLALSSGRSFMPSADILLLDICMPEPDGFELIRMLARHPRRDQLSIILVSGSDERMLQGAARLCKSHGLDLLATFRKPFSVLALCDLLETVEVRAA